jgi:CHAD domain-containing protein
MALDIERLRRSTRRLTKFAKRNPKRPSSDAVHKLRTSARHVQSALVALELDSRPGVTSLLRDLEKTRRLTGKVRDMDVLTADVLHVDWSGEQDCLVRLLEHLGAERSRRARKLRAAMAKRRSRFSKSLERGLERVERAAEDAGGSDSEAVRGAVARAIELSSKLSRPGRLTTKSLHAYRLKVKELRDVLRLSDRAADSKLVAKLDEVKAAIGEWHDWAELTDIAVEVLDHASCALLKRLKATRDAKYKHALSLTQTLIARHLRPRAGSRKRSRARAPIAEPVIEAVADLAR